jgi:opacity protein-like surface antigen
MVRLSLISMVTAGGWSSAGAEFNDPFSPDGVSGWYEVGPTHVEDATLRDYFGNPVAGNTVKFNPGFHFGIGIGQELTPYLKVEVESGFNYNSLDVISGATASSGNFYRAPVLGNVVLQFPNRTGLVPVIGAGVGGQWLHLDAQNISLGGTTVNDESDTWAFTYQGFAGVRYEFGDRFSLGLFYRYNFVDGPSWEFDNLPGNLKLNSLRTHSLSLTLGWWF